MEIAEKLQLITLDQQTYNFFGAWIRLFIVEPCLLPFRRNIEPLEQQELQQD